MTTFEEAFEETGHGKFNHIILLTCGLILMYAMVESLGVGYIITLAGCELELTSYEKGMINASAFIGIFSTAIFWGYLSDRFGRRAVMLPAILASSFISFSSSLSGNFTTLFVLRFLTGCLVSASSATVFAYLGEMHSDSRRATAIAFGSTFIALTFIVLPVMAWLILPGRWSFTMINVKMVPWRVYIWSWCAPGLLAAIIMIFLPESPRYLFAVKGQGEAISVLATIYACNHKTKNKEDYPVKSIDVVTPAIAQRGFRNACNNFGQLLRPPLLKCVLISHFSMFMVFCLSSGLYTWMPQILNEVLFHVHQPVSMCEVVMSKYKNELTSDVNICDHNIMNPMVFPVSMIMGTLCATTYISIGYIMRDRSKICIYCVLLAVCSLILAVSTVLPQPVVSIIMFIIGLCCGCSASVLAAIAVEVFPTCVRALALCTLYMAGRSGAAVGANLIGLGLREHCVVILCLTCIITAGSTLLMLCWPDPKSVRTLMEGRGFAY